MGEERRLDNTINPRTAKDLYYSLEAALKDSFPPNNSQFEIHIEEDR